MTNKEQVILGPVFFGDERKGKKWAKHVTEIDKEQKGGYAFLGDFISKYSQEEVPVGAIILSVGFLGSWKNGELHAQVSRVDSEGTPILLEEFVWGPQKIEIRNFIEKLLQEEKSELMQLHVCN